MFIQFNKYIDNSSKEQKLKTKMNMVTNSDKGWRECERALYNDTLKKVRKIKRKTLCQNSKKT